MRQTSRLLIVFVLSLPAVARADVNGFRQYGATTIIASVGGNFPNPRMAVDSLDSWCTDPTAGNRCLIQIMPGRYDVGGVGSMILPSFVDMEGAGADKTLLIAAGSASNADATVVCEPDVVIQSIAVYNDGSGHVESRAIRELPDGNLSLSFVYAEARGGVRAVAIDSTGYLRMEDSVAVAAEATETSVGLTVRDAEAVVFDSQIFADSTGARQARGLQSDDSRGTLSRVSIQAMAGTLASAIHTTGSDWTVSDSTITATGAADALGIYSPPDPSGPGSLDISRSNVSATGQNGSARGLQVAPAPHPEPEGREKIHFYDGVIESCGTVASETFGVDVYDRSAVRIQDSVVTACNGGVTMKTHDGAELFVGLSRLEGAPVDESSGGTVACTAVTDQNGVFYPDTCPAQNNVAVANVVSYGAVPDDELDDTVAVKRAILAAREYGTVYFPTGSYLVAQELLVDKPVNIVGEGNGTQIFQRADQGLFHLKDVQGVIVRDLFLGSSATASGKSLLKLTNSHRNRIEGITMLGGYYGLHLQGSLLNVVVDLKSGANFSGAFFQCPSLDECGVSTNQYWVMLSRYGVIAPNANSFVGTSLEGGTNGIWVQDTSSESNLFLYGGTIEGVSNVGLTLRGSHSPTIVSGMHFEENQVADVDIDNAKNVRLDSILATNLVRVRNDSRAVSVTNSAVDSLHIAATAIRTRLDNVVWNLSTNGVFEDLAADTIAINVANNEGGHARYQSGIGVWKSVTTLDSKLEVGGAAGVESVIFREGDTGKWKLFERDDGLYVENLIDNQIYKLMTQ